MSRWRVAAAIVASAALLRCSGDDRIERARRITAEQIGIDTHIDTMQRVLIEGADIGRRLEDGHADLVRLREGGMRAPFFALWVPTYYKGSEAVRRTLQLRDAFDRLVEKYPKAIELATTAEDLERIARRGKVAAVLTIEGGHQIADDLAVLRVYHRLGIRSMTLTHFRNNNWADASTDLPQHNGLTPFGKEVVREMNRIGMIVDVSHVSDKTFFDALETTVKPVIASHSSCRALTDIPRNLTDDQLRALARNGGVVGINFGSGFLNDRAAAGLRQAISTARAREPNLSGKALDDYARDDHLRELHGPSNEPPASIADLVAHIDHAVRVAGVDHVGIGSDFDGVGSLPVGLEDVSKMPALTAALVGRGYSDEDIKKILGGNVSRVLRAVVGR